MSDRLTPRQNEVLSMVRQGLGPREIAARLQISSHTARKHRDEAVKRNGTGSQWIDPPNNATA